MMKLYIISIINDCDLHKNERLSHSIPCTKNVARLLYYYALKL